MINSLLRRRRRDVERESVMRAARIQYQADRETYALRALLQSPKPTSKRESK